MRFDSELAGCFLEMPATWDEPRLSGSPSPCKLSLPRRAPSRSRGPAGPKRSLLFMENRMKVLVGEIGVVGGGRGAGARKGNVLSILEIGEHQLKRIVLPDALREPMKAGRHARILL